MTALLTNPLLYFLGVLALLAASLLLKRRRLVAIGVLIPLALLCYFIITPHGANYLAGTVAAGSSADQCSAELGVIYGTALDSRAQGPRDYGALSDIAFDKVTAAVDWLADNPHRHLVISGNSETNYPGVPTDAVIAYHYIAATGIERSRLTYNPHASSSIYQNMQNLYDLTEQRELTLFSSTLSADRAQAVFAAHGFNVCTLVVDNRQVSAWHILGYLPNGESIELTQDVFYEYAARIWYWLTDKT